MSASGYLEQVCREALTKSTLDGCRDVLLEALGEDRPDSVTPASVVEPCEVLKNAALDAMRVLDFACRLLRVSDIPRGNGRWYRLTLRLLDARYMAALDLHGRDFARRYDYVPF